MKLVTAQKAAAKEKAPKLKVKMTPKSTAITMRLTEETADFFNRLAQNAGKSKADFLKCLLDSYQPPGQGEKQARPSADDGPLEVYLCKKYYPPYDAGKAEELYKYEFNGEVLHFPAKLTARRAQPFATALRDDFGLADLPEDAELIHGVNLYRDDDANKFLANEIIKVIKRKGEGEIKRFFWLSRCAHVESFGEFRDKFATYITAGNLTAVEFSMAQRITGNCDEIFDRFF